MKIQSSLRSLPLALSTLVAVSLTFSAVGQDATALPPVAGSEEAFQIAAIAREHPAVASLVNYLQADISHNVTAAADYIEPTSLSAFKARTINAVRTKLNSVAALDSAAEIQRVTSQMFDELGFTSLADMDATPPKGFYIKLNHRQNENNPSAEQMPLDTVGVQVLGLAAEDDARVVHFVTRTTHREEVMLVSRIQLTSMVKAGNEWFVSLQAQRQRLEPLPDDVVKKERKEMENDPEQIRLNNILEESEKVEDDE